MRSIRASKVQPPSGNTQQRSQIARFTSALPSEKLPLPQAKRNYRSHTQNSIRQGDRAQSRSVTVNHRVLQQNITSKAFGNHGSPPRDHSHPTDLTRSLVSRERPKTHAFSMPTTTYFHRREEDLKGWSWQSSETWRSAVSSTASEGQIPPGKKRRRARSNTYDILQYVPNYVRVRSRLRGKILRRVWFSLRAETKRTFMESALIYALKDCPILAFDILQDLVQLKIYVPRMIVQDTLARAGAAKLVSSARHADVHRRTIKLLYSKLGLAMSSLAPDISYTMDSAVILAVCRRLSRRQLRRFLHELPPDPGKLLSSRTLLQLIHIAARHRLIHQSISLLRRLLGRAEDFFLVQWACVRLIRISLYFLSRDKLHSLRVQFIHEILRTGLIPNDSLRNAIIQTFMEGGEPGTAWAVFRKSVDQGLSPTKGTFFALLQRHPYHELCDIQELINMARVHGCLDSSFGHRALDAVGQLYRREENCLNKPFHSALRVYVQFFDVQPLVDIGLVDKDLRADFIPIDSPRLTPQPKAIDLMIRTFCRQFTGSLQIWLSYQKFITLVFNGHHLFGQVALKPWPFEFFMVGMSTHPDLLRPCAQVLQHMMDQRIDEDASRLTSSGLDAEATTAFMASTSGRVDSSSLQQAHQTLSLRNTKSQIAQPRSTTWNILLSSLVNAHKLDAAEELVEMMQEEGFKPTLVTWNTLIDGFSNAQDSKKVAFAVEQMENQRFVADDRTRRALTRVLNRTALFAELDKALRRRANSIATD